MVFFKLFLCCFMTFCCSTPPMFFTLSFTLHGKDKMRAIDLMM